MGSFWGHIDEGAFFILMALWWMGCAFKEYIVTENSGKTMKPKMHNETKVCKSLPPLEIIFKIIFPFVGFMGEFIDGGVRFMDSEGNFVKLVYQQHMTIYGIFIIHGISDLLSWFRAPVFPMFNYLTAFLAFMWYGVAFYYHASMHGKEPVEVIVHILPIYVMFVTSIAILLEMKWQEGVWTFIVRAYGVLTLGTWFSHVAWMLYVHNSFPGGARSSLDRRDPNNVTMVKAMFGMHLIINLLITIVVYTLVYTFLYLKHGITIKVSSLHDVERFSYQYVSLSEEKFDLKSEAFNFQEKVPNETSSEDSAMMLEPLESP